MFSSRTTALPSLPTVASFSYPSTASTLQSSVLLQEPPSVPEPIATEEALRTRLAAERAAGYAECEARLRRECEQKSAAESARIAKAIADFETSRKEYFRHVESEVVQLALAISRRILHREAQVEPMLVAAIVQISLAQLKDGSAVTIRVQRGEVQKWREHFVSLDLKLSVSIVEDDELVAGDCILETELGSVNMSLAVQLKEVEQGFFDVLAQKPKM